MSTSSSSGNLRISAAAGGTITVGGGSEASIVLGSSGGATATIWNAAFQAGPGATTFTGAVSAPGVSVTGASLALSSGVNLASGGVARLVPAFTKTFTSGAVTSILSVGGMAGAVGDGGHHGAVRVEYMVSANDGAAFQTIAESATFSFVSVGGVTSGIINAPTPVVAGAGTLVCVWSAAMTGDGSHAAPAIQAAITSTGPTAPTITMTGMVHNLCANAANALTFF